MHPEESKKILIDVQKKLLEVMDIVKELPQGYQYKVREMLSCAETVISMYNDIQHGIIPDVLRNGVNNEVPKETTEEIQEEVVQEEPVVQEEVKTVSNKKVLDIGDIDLD